LIVQPAGPELQEMVVLGLADRPGMVVGLHEGRCHMLIAEK
jgi:hypothetical protein